MRCWVLGAARRAGGLPLVGSSRCLLHLVSLCSAPLLRVRGPASLRPATCELQPVGAAAAHPPATCPFSRPAYPGHQRLCGRNAVQSLHRTGICAPWSPLLPGCALLNNAKDAARSFSTDARCGGPPSHTSSTPPATPSPPPSRLYRHTASGCFSSIPSLSTWFCCAVQPPSELLRDRKLYQSHRDTPLAVPSAALLLLLHRHPFQAPVAMLPTTVLPSRGHGGNLQPCDLPRTSSSPPCCQCSPTC
ncbi:hypothetical protein IWZ01DRAFT_209249 [Phyllosticta capitalensis]|uniref:Uncharacterized protein n=1 Tax=Phyllosticta capitalensis TaxID=121624 RepID=A0ABR1YVC7_9PEZI